MFQYAVTLISGNMPRRVPVAVSTITEHDHLEAAGLRALLRLYAGVRCWAPWIAQASNTDKIAALFHDAGLDSWRCERSLDVARVDAKASGWSEQEYRSWCAYLDEAASEVERLFSDLAKLAANR